MLTNPTLTNPTLTNPATGESLGPPRADRDDALDRKFADASRAFAQWRDISEMRRWVLLIALAKVLESRVDAMAELATREMGKTLASARAEVQKCAQACALVAAHAKDWLRHEQITSDATQSSVRYDPLGVILGIMPWNFPYWQAIRFAVPAIAAGNVAMLKHAPNVPGCAAALHEAFIAAGFPDGVFSVAYVPDNQAAQALMARPEVAAVSITGSTRAGKAVASAAGAVLKKCVLELGGSDAFIVLADVDIPAVAAAAAHARCINNGQSCIAAKRFIVEAKIADAFESAMSAVMRGLRVGDPMDQSTEVGPLARADLRNALHDQVQRSIGRGARLCCGGAPLDRPGFFYAPTVLSDVKPGMAAFDEETFGPVAALVRADDPDHAIALANQSEYGLGASIWTRDVAQARTAAAKLEAGLVFINAPVASDARLPFGGIKSSGYGRELSAIGLREFTNVKTVWIK